MFVRGDEEATAASSRRGSRSLFSGMGHRERAPEAAVSILDRKGEALQILKSHEESGQGWFWSTDAEGRVTYLTESLGALLAQGGADPAGAHLTDLFTTAEDDEDRRRTLPFALAKETPFSKLVVTSGRGEALRVWEISGIPFADASGAFAGFRGSGADITEQRRSSAHASKLAMFDPLTALANRRRMQHTLDALLRGYKHSQRSCAVLLIDLDRFKQVNDTLGHPAGDALLKQVAERLLKVVGNPEFVYRLGGDEFQVVLPDVADRGILSDLATQIIALISQPYTIEGARCLIGASIGVAVSPFDGSERSELIRNADLALYAAKDGGRGRHCFFTAEFLRKAEERRVIEEELRDAVVRGEMELHYQPIVDAVSNCVKGVEALCRWKHPERGYVSPGLFIPVAEEANLIQEIGDWALRKACMDAAAWPAPIRVAVNVSPVQFGAEGFPLKVKSALDSSGLAPDRLEIELTESVFLNQTDQVDATFLALKKLGVRLALDDFGTGYSSLGYLRNAPFDKIKIDQSFVRGTLDPKARNGAIIAAIVALAKALDLETTAEGIESFDQLKLMRELQVSHIQGFIYSRPVPNQQLVKRLQDGEWVIEPSGPAKQRHVRHSVFRKAGAIHGDHIYPVIIRNLSVSGALMQGIVDVPLGTQFVIDLGDGQFAIATVKRSKGDTQGVAFEEHLVEDGNGALCTRHRVSSYMLAMAGIKSLHDTAEGGFAMAKDRPATLPAFRTSNDWKSAPGNKRAA